MSNFGLFYQRYGCNKGFNGRCIIAGGCLLNGTWDRIWGNFFVLLQMLFHFRLRHWRWHSLHSIFGRESDFVAIISVIPLSTPWPVLSGRWLLTTVIIRRPASFAFWSAICSGFYTLKGYLQRHYEIFASIIMSNFWLFDQWDGCNKGFNSRCIIASGCILYGTTDSIWGDLFVDLQILLHFWLGHCWCCSRRRILGKEARRRDPGTHPK